AAAERARARCRCGANRACAAERECDARDRRRRRGRGRRCSRYWTLDRSRTRARRAARSLRPAREPRRGGFPRVTRLPVEVFIVVRRGEEYLVVHRVPEAGAYWHGIAGGVEEGESPEEAAARELREETGLDARPTPLANSFSYNEITVHTFLIEVPPRWEP